MSGFLEFGFGENDNAARSGKTEKFKGETGRSYRLSFCWWPGSDASTPDLDAKTPKFVGAKRFYFEGVGYVIDGGPEFSKVANGPSRMAIATVVVQWPMDASGQIDMARVKACDFKVLPWIFSQDKYKTLTPLHNEFPFGGHDITVTCSDAKFQKMTFAPCKDSLLRKFIASDKDSAKKVAEYITGQTAGIITNIQSDLGREMSIDTLRDKLSGGGSSPMSVTSTSAATEDIDGLVDDILD